MCYETSAIVWINFVLPFDSEFKFFVDRTLELRTLCLLEVCLSFVISIQSLLELR
jgi:hypothetical protein